MIAAVTDTTNLIVNLLTVIVIVIGFFTAIPYARGKRSARAIEDLEHALDAAQERITATEHTANDAKEEAVKCFTEAAEWKARYEEAKIRYEEALRYTAREAVEHFEAMMADHSAKVAERHERMLNHLDIQTEASRSLAELTGHNTAIVAAIAEKIGVGQTRPFQERSH